MKHGTGLSLRLMAFAMAVCFLLSGLLTARAAPVAPQVLEQKVEDDFVYLFFKHSASDPITEAKVGNETTGLPVVTNSSNFPIMTWLLLDNSNSISEGDRAKAKDLFTNLVANRTPNEKFILCTYSEHLNVVREESSDYANLKTGIDSLSHSDQESYLTDALEELLNWEDTRVGVYFTRIIVVCDGVDNNPEGITREELNRRLAQKNFPIYTIGCRNNTGNEPLLKDLYSLARETGGVSWTLTDIAEPMQIVQELGSTELPTRVAVPIPESMKDGSSKGVQVTYSDGTVFTTQAVMPFGPEPVAPDPPPQPQTPPETVDESTSADTSEETEPPEEDEEETGFLDNIPPTVFIGATVVLVIAVIGVIAALVFVKKKNQNVPPSQTVPMRRGRDVNIPPTMAINPGRGGQPGVLGHVYHLILSDRGDSGFVSDTPIQGPLSIGRSSRNNVVINYDNSVSGDHCEIFQSGGAFWVRDVGSLNGTYVDGVQIPGGQQVQISNGSVLKLGNLEFTVMLR